jgi:hypothetical protein
MEKATGGVPVTTETSGNATAPKPSIGRIVIYTTVEHPGVPSVDVPAIVTATQKENSSLEHEQAIDLTAFTPIGPGTKKNVMPGPDDEPKSGCWRWPERV